MRSGRVRRLLAPSVAPSLHHWRPAPAWYGVGAQPSARRLSARRRPFSVRMHAYDSISHSCFRDPIFGIVRGAWPAVAMWRAARWMQHLHQELRLARQTGSGLRYRALRWFCSRGREEDRGFGPCLRLMRPLDRPLRRRSSPNHKLSRCDHGGAVVICTSSSKPAAGSCGRTMTMLEDFGAPGGRRVTSQPRLVPAERALRSRRPRRSLITFATSLRGESARLGSTRVTWLLRRHQDRFG